MSRLIKENNTIKKIGTDSSYQPSTLDLENRKAEKDLSNVSANKVLDKVKEVDGDNSGLDADSVDGIQGAQIVRNDTENILKGKLTIDTTTDGALTNRYIYLTSNEINLYSNASADDDTYLRTVLNAWDNGDAFEIVLRNKDNTTLNKMIFDREGAVKLNDKKILVEGDVSSGGSVGVPSCGCTKNLLINGAWRISQPNRVSIDLTPGYILDDDTEHFVRDRWKVKGGDGIIATQYLDSSEDASNTSVILQDSEISKQALYSFEPDERGDTYVSPVDNSGNVNNAEWKDAQDNDKEGEYSTDGYRGECALISNTDRFLIASNYNDYFSYDDYSGVLSFWFSIPSMPDTDNYLYIARFAEFEEDNYKKQYALAVNLNSGSKELTLVKLAATSLLGDPESIEEETGIQTIEENTWYNFIIRGECKSNSSSFAIDLFIDGYHINTYDKFLTPRYVNFGIDTSNENIEKAYTGDVLIDEVRQIAQPVYNIDAIKNDKKIKKYNTRNIFIWPYRKKIVFGTYYKSASILYKFEGRHLYAYRNSKITLSWSGYNISTPGVVTPAIKLHNATGGSITESIEISEGQYDSNLNRYYATFDLSQFNNELKNDTSLGCILQLDIYLNQDYYGIHQCYNFQLEAGDTPTEFEQIPYELELKNCQRYYRRADVDMYTPVTEGANDKQQATGPVLQVKDMRTTPSISPSSFAIYLTKADAWYYFGLDWNDGTKCYHLYTTNGSSDSSDIGHVAQYVQLDAEL